MDEYDEFEEPEELEVFDELELLEELEPPPPVIAAKSGCMLRSNDNVKMQSFFMDFPQ